MSRLYDRLRRFGVRSPVVRPDIGEHIASVAERATVLAIDNVAEYYFCQSGKRPGQWVINDFPNLAPPFTCYFMDWENRPVYWDAEWYDLLAAAGVLFEAFDASVAGWCGAETVPPEAKWVINALVLIERRVGESLYPVQVCEYAVDASGRSVGSIQMSALGARTTNVEKEASLIAWLLLPALLATSFLHCKNIVLADGQATRAERRRQDREGVRPLVRYKTLEIEPIKQILKHEGKSEETGLKHALHICRGHFATYGEERPLFGRVSGTFWKPMHVRGSLKQGAVVKDYAVNRP